VLLRLRTSFCDGNMSRRFLSLIRTSKGVLSVANRHLVGGHFHASFVTAGPNHIAGETPRNEEVVPDWRKYPDRALGKSLNFRPLHLKLITRYAVKVRTVGPSVHQEVRLAGSAGPETPSDVPGLIMHLGCGAANEERFWRMITANPAMSRQNLRQFFPVIKGNLIIPANVN
jgi:hypothetical protein